MGAGTAFVLAGFLGTVTALSWVQRPEVSRGLTSAPHSCRHHLLPSGSLRLAQAQAGDSGLYQCRASNPAGSAARHYVLGVQGRRGWWLLSDPWFYPDFSGLLSALPQLPVPALSPPQGGLQASPSPLLPAGLKPHLLLPPPLLYPSHRLSGTPPTPFCTPLTPSPVPLPPPPVPLPPFPVPLVAEYRGQGPSVGTWGGTHRGFWSQPIGGPGSPSQKPVVESLRQRGRELVTYKSPQESGGSTNQGPRATPSPPAVCTWPRAGGEGCLHLETRGGRAMFCDVWTLYDIQVSGHRCTF